MGAVFIDRALHLGNRGWGVANGVRKTHSTKISKILLYSEDLNSANAAEFKGSEWHKYCGIRGSE